MDRSSPRGRLLLGYGRGERSRQEQEERVFTVEALEHCFEFAHYKIWVDDHTYEYKAVAMHKNDRKMGQKQ